MNLEHQTKGDATLITVNEPRIDAAIAIQFKDKVREVTQDGPPRVVLDMSQVDFLDSSGLGALVAVMKQLSPDRSFELAGLTGAVEKVFRLTRMDSVFKVHSSVKDAVAQTCDDT
ncbi:MAG: STAS domain-containing protein [Pseudomonadota bacterium]